MTLATHSEFVVAQRPADRTEQNSAPGYICQLSQTVTELSQVLLSGCLLTAAPRVPPDD
jgi:hypothetical protein